MPETAGRVSCPSVRTRTKRARYVLCAFMFDIYGFLNPAQLFFWYYPSTAKGNENDLIFW